MLLDLPCDVICSVARFRLRAHTLQVEIVTTCEMLMMYRMSNTSFSTAPIHTLSLSDGLMLPFFLPQA